jgi:mono/diheme cytochrome c family protein
MKLKTQYTVWAALAGFTMLTHAQPAPSETRGELLYNTHCLACHTTQMHWRNGRQAFDWESLKFQVRRWQGNAGLAWNDADIAEVSRYLNEAIYHYPQINDRVGLASPQKVHVFGWRNIQPRLVVVRAGPSH